MSTRLGTIAKICCSRSISAWGRLSGEIIRVGSIAHPPSVFRLDIMDSLAKRTESAYQKLYSWVRKQALELASSSFDVDPVFVKVRGGI